MVWRAALTFVLALFLSACALVPVVALLDDEPRKAPEKPDPSKARSFLEFDLGTGSFGKLGMSPPTIIHFGIVPGMGSEHFEFQFRFEFVLDSDKAGERIEDPLLSPRSYSKEATLISMGPGLAFYPFSGVSPFISVDAGAGIALHGEVPAWYGGYGVGACVGLALTERGRRRVLLGLRGQMLLDTGYRKEAPRYGGIYLAVRIG